MFRIDPLYGMKVFVNFASCQPQFRGWRRVHRRKRIAKKWRKKYGAVLVCPGKAVQLAGTGLILCPCADTALKKRLNN